MDETAKPLVRLLLVDDETDYLESLGKALGRRGFEVHAFPRAEAALELLDGGGIDVAVLDVKMPGLDGIGLFRVIRRRWPALPIIMLTGHGTIQQAFQTSREGVFEYLTKPCDVDRLAELAKSAVARSQESASEPPPAVDEDSSPVRVLLVDDEEEFLQVHARLLKRRGLEVETATSGKAGLEIVRQGRCDVAVVDLRMPGMDGLELLQAIKRVRPDVEVVVLTGQPSVSAALKAVREGAFDFAAKPQEVEVLVARIRAASRHRLEALAAERREAVDALVKGRPD